MDPALSPLTDSQESVDNSTEEQKTAESRASMPSRRLVFQKWNSPVFATSHDILKNSEIANSLKEETPT